MLRLIEGLCRSDIISHPGRVVHLLLFSVSLHAFHSSWLCFAVVMELALLAIYLVINFTYLFLLTDSRSIFLPVALEQFRIYSSDMQSERERYSALRVFIALLDSFERGVKSPEVSGFSCLFPYIEEYLLLVQYFIWRHECSNPDKSGTPLLPSSLSNVFTEPFFNWFFHIFSYFFCGVQLFSDMIG